MVGWLLSAADKAASVALIDIKRCDSHIKKGNFPVVAPKVTG